MRTGKRRPDSSNPRSVVIAVRVQPRAARTEVVGMYGGAVKIRLTAPPVDGAANGELVRFLAAQLGVRRRDVQITGGATTRTKRVRIEGTSLTEEEILRRLVGGDAS